MTNTLKDISKLVDECRLILEEKGDCCPVLVSYEKSKYTLDKTEIIKLAQTLYEVDCYLEQIKEYLNNKNTLSTRLMRKCNKLKK
jgi:hypothetical protein